MKKLNKKSKVLVIGDLMLDEYIDGDVIKISPEAPVPVIKINKKFYRLGGAANVAANINSLGINSHIHGAIGKDSSGKIIKKLLKGKNISYDLIEDSNFKTVKKTRIISNFQQLIRLDEEQYEPKINFKKNILDALRKKNEIKVVICSDYSKGMLKNIDQIISYAKRYKISLIIDPKGVNFQKYKNADMLTPNLEEFENVMGKCSNLLDLEIKGKKLRKLLNLNALLVTRGKSGMTLFEKNKPPFHIESSAREVSDVTGAGDTVIGVIGGLISKGINLKDAVIAADKAAGLSVAKFGATTVSLQEILEEKKIVNSLPKGFINNKLLNNFKVENRNPEKTLVVTNGCFDILHTGHITLLSKAKKLGDHLMVLLNDDLSVTKLKGAGRPVNKLMDRAKHLLALESVDSVISFTDVTPKKLYETIKPDILVKGADYEVHEIAGAETVISNGGKVELISLVTGFSSTSIIKKINNFKQ